MISERALFLASANASKGAVWPGLWPQGLLRPRENTRPAHSPQLSGRAGTPPPPSRSRSPARGGCSGAQLVTWEVWEGQGPGRVRLQPPTLGMSWAGLGTQAGWGIGQARGQGPASPLAALTCGTNPTFAESQSSPQNQKKDARLGLVP